MPDAFRLAPKDKDHESWLFSLTTKPVYIIAYDEEEARLLVDGTLYCKDHLPKPKRWCKQDYPDSPWRLHEITSCERDTSGVAEGNYVVTEDGEKWPVWRPSESLGGLVETAT